MILLLALQAIRFGHPGDPVAAYKNCMAPIVWANERAEKTSYQPPENILDRIKVQCAKERQRVGDQMIGQILHGNPDLWPLPTDGEQESLVQGQTIQWVSDVIARMPPEEK